MNICVGLSHPSPAWEQWCAQDGVPSAHVQFGEAALLEEYAVIILTATPDVDQASALEEFLRGGGAIMGSAAHALGIAGTRTRPGQIDFLLPGEPFPEIGVLDLDCRCAIPIEANVLVTSGGSPAMFFGPLGNGFAALLPFDLQRVIADARSTTRLFPFERERLPFERVSAVAKGEALSLIRRSLERLFAARKIPLIRKALYPEGAESVVLFRVDSDGASPVEVNELHNLAHQHEIPISWFLDVKSHEGWIGEFAGLEGDELGVHCYDHEVFARYDQNSTNIRRALDALSKAGIHAEGFSAPLGEWNQHLAAAIDDAGFVYSSEFSYIYDALPLFPETSGRAFSTLQIPVHPICPGSLKRVGYSEVQMQRYFESAITQKLHRGQPLVFYHHPKDRFPGALAGLFAALQHHGPKLTMGQFARWWKSRLALRFSATTIDEHAVEILSDGGHNDVPFKLEIVRPDGRSAIMPVDRRIEFDRCQWRDPIPGERPVEQLRRARTFDLRMFMAEKFTHMTRWSR